MKLIKQNIFSLIPLKQGLILTFLVTQIAILSAHGDLHDRIIALTHQIEMYPDSADLYFKRGNLLLQHEEFERSIEDFNVAQLKGLDNLEIDFQKAMAYYNLKDYGSCLVHTDKVIYRDPNHVRSIRLKAKVYFDKKEFGKAAIYFNHVLLKAQDKLPENYLEAAKAYELLGGETAILKSENILLAGIENLGKLISFYNRLVYISTLERDFDKVIHYQTEIINLSDRKERAYYNRALSYAITKDFDSARADLELSMQAIKSLKRKLRKGQDMVDLLMKIDEEHQKIEAITGR